MNRNPLRPVLLAATLAACTAPPELLNSDRIEDRYGSYGVEIVAQDETSRRSNLFSVSNGVRTTRTYAVVHFVEPAAAPLIGTHRKIVAGGSIGSTLRDDGWTVHKKTVYIGDLALTDLSHPVAARMRLDAPARLALHAYQLHVENTQVSLHYATVVETHHPDYLSQDGLLSIYPIRDETSLSSADIEALTSLVLARD